MNVFAYISDFQYRMKAGELNMFEIIILGILLGYGILYTVKMNNKNTKIRQNELLTYVFTGVVMIYVLNIYRRNMFIERKKLYKKKGLTDGEAEQLALTFNRKFL